MMTLNLETITDTQSWYKIQPLNGFSLVRAERNQSCPCGTKTSQETETSLRKFLEPSAKPKVIEFNTDSSLESGKSCEDLSWNRCTSTPHRSETHGIAERAVPRIKGGRFAVLLQSRLDGKWWADSTERCCHLPSVQSPPGRWKNTL